MKTRLQTRCELLAENRNKINKGFWLQNSLIKIASALVYTEGDKTVDNAYLKECRGVLRKNQGIFSEFRSMNEIMVSAKLAQQADPEKYMEEISATYKKLTQGKLFGSRYVALAAMNISDARRFNEADSIVEKTSAILKGMKKDHPFLTTDEDTCFAVLLAMTDKSVENILTELEETYKTLKKDFSFHDNSVYSLAQVLTMKQGTVAEKCSQVVDIYNAFRDSGIKYGKDYEFPSLGVLVGLNVRTEEIVNEVVDASDFLKTQKGFGMLDCSERHRLMFSAILYAGTMDESVLTSASAFDSTIAMVIAEEIAFMMMMCVVASTTAANSTR